MLPVGVGLVVLIAGLSATMSSASSDAIAAVSILFRDVHSMVTGPMPDRTRMVGYARWGLLGITLSALVVTLSADNIIGYIKDMISFVMSGLVIATVMGKYWRRATWQGGLVVQSRSRARHASRVSCRVVPDSSHPEDNMSLSTLAPLKTRRP